MKPLHENTIVYQDQAGVTAIGALSRRVLHQAQDASDVIQRAIDAGGTVTLERGRYALSRTLKLTDNVTLAGQGRGTVIVADKNAAILAEKSVGVTVRDLAVDGGTAAPAGIVFDALFNAAVIGVVVRGFDRGIWFRNHTTLSRVSGCSLAGNRMAHVFFEQLREGPYGNYIPNQIENTMAFGGGPGFVCSNAIVVNLVGCTAYQTTGPGFHIHTQANSVLLSGCRTFQITGPAVLVENAYEFNATGNIFCWATEHGIVVRDCRWGVISGNEIIDVGSFNPQPEIPNFSGRKADYQMPMFDCVRLEKTAGYSVTGNSLFNWPVLPPMDTGIREDAECRENIIVGNSINKFDRADIASAGKDSVVAQNVSRKDCHTGDWDRLQTFQRDITAEMIRRML
jgi:hypothetical protein